MSGGNLEILFPFLSLSSNCFANNRLCAANASRGDNSGGTSPAIHNRGDGSDRRDGDGISPPMGPWDCDLRSINIGRFVMALGCSSGMEWVSKVLLSLSRVSRLENLNPIVIL